MSLIQQHRKQLGTVPLCRALKVPRASFYRQQGKNASTALVVTRRRPKHALSQAERQTVLATLRDPRFVDLAPPQVYAHLLEEGRYRRPGGSRQCLVAQLSPPATPRRCWPTTIQGWADGTQGGVQRMQH